LAKGIRDASARSRDVGSHRAARRIAKIAKTFIMAKEIRAMRVKSLRANKSLRDHGAIPASVSQFQRAYVERGSPARPGAGGAASRDDPASPAGAAPRLPPPPRRSQATAPPPCPVHHHALQPGEPAPPTVTPNTLSGRGSGRWPIRAIRAEVIEVHHCLVALNSLPIPPKVTRKQPSCPCDWAMLTSRIGSYLELSALV
jgi:hypothetical protein